MDPELSKLVVEWYQAASGPARDLAFNMLVQYMARNPAAVGTLESGVIVAAYEVHLLRIFAQGAAARIAQRRALPSLTVHIARLGANFGRIPKVPNHVATTMIFIGAVFLTGCEMAAEDEQRQAAIPSYNLYLAKYLQGCALALQRHPKAQLVSPLQFEEWYQQNRT